MQQGKRALVAVLAIALTITVAAPAGARTDHQRRIVRKNKITSQTILHHHASKPHRKPSLSTRGRVVYCREAHEVATSVSLVGLRVWSFGLRAHFCYDGYHVTSVRWDKPYGSTASWTSWAWDSDKTYVQSNRGKIGSPYVYRRVASQFHACIFWYCTQRQPFVSLTLKADGWSPGDGSIDTGP